MVESPIIQIVVFFLIGGMKDKNAIVAINVNLTPTPLPGERDMTS